MTGARISGVKVAAGGEENVGDALEEFMQDLGNVIQGNARRIVPVLSGDLSLSIVSETERDGDLVELQVGVDEEIVGVDYGLYVEKGTSKMSAQPFLVPAVLQAGGTVSGWAE